MSSARPAVLVMAAMFGVCGAAALAQPTFTSDVMTTPIAVSADGRVVVGEQQGAGAAYWTRARGRVLLGNPPGMSNSRAVGVSGDGAVIAVRGTSSTGGTTGWMWTQAGGMVSVTVPNTTRVEATCLSRDGRTVGGIATGTGSGFYHSFVWTASEGGRLIPEGSNYSSWLHALSPDGSKAIGSGSSGIGTWGMLWNSTYVWCQNLGMADGNLQAIPLAMTPDASTVVGNMGTSARNSAVVWTPAGANVCTVPAGWQTSNLLAVSDDGSVAGGYQHGSNSSGVIWRRGVGLLDANAYFQARGVQAVGISEIDAISANGRVFVGRAGGGFIIDLGACGSADFDHDGSTGTDQDIEAFFRCLSGNCCPLCDGADFNFDGDGGTDADIEAFFRVLAGGHC